MHPTVPVLKAYRYDSLQCYSTQFRHKIGSGQLQCTHVHCYYILTQLLSRIRQLPHAVIHYRFNIYEKCLFQINECSCFKYTLETTLVHYIDIINWILPSTYLALRSKYPRALSPKENNWNLRLSRPKKRIYSSKIPGKQLWPPKM